MLKRRIGSIVLSAAMLAGTIAVPVSAKHVVREDVPTILTLINETFDDYTVSENPQSVSNGGSPGSATFTQNENIVLKTGGWGSQKFSIVNDSNTDNYMSFTNDGDAFVQFKNPNGSTSITEGDIIKINFDMKFDSDLSKNQKQTSFKLLLNDNLSTYYKFKSTSKKDDPYLKSGESAGTLLAMKHDTGVFASADDTASGPKVIGDTWVNYSIVLDTKDEDNDNKQTLRVTAKYNNGTIDVEDYVFGYFDADKSNNSDTETYDLVKEFSSLTMSIGQWKGDEEVRYQPNTRVNNFKVTLETIKNKVTGAKSDMEEVVIDEPLTNLGVDDKWKGGYNESFVGNSKTVSTKTLASWSQASHKASADGLMVSYGNGGKINFKNPSTSTDVKEGDVVKISFKAKNTAGSVGTLVVNFSDRSETTCNAQTGDIKSTDGKKSRFTPIEGDKEMVTYESNNEQKTEQSQIISYPRLNEGDSDYTGRIMSFNMKDKKYGISNKFNWSVYQASQRLSNSEWNDITVTINTKDASCEGKQTMKIEASYPDGESTYKSYMKGYFDADYKGDSEDTTYDMLDKIGSLTISSNTGNYPCYGDNVGDVVATFKDVKVTVTHQGLEAWGDATTKDNIEGALDDDKFLAGSTLEARAYVNPTETNTMLIAAVYDGDGVLIDCKTAKQPDENFTGLITAEVSTMGAKTVKMFAVDSTTLAPKLVSKTLTVDESAINANSSH